MNALLDTLSLVRFKNSSRLLDLSRVASLRVPHVVCPLHTQTELDIIDRFYFDASKYVI